MSGEEVLCKDRQLLWTMNGSGHKLSEKYNYGFLKSSPSYSIRENLSGSLIFTEKSECKYERHSGGKFNWFSGCETTDVQGEIAL